MSPSNHAGLLAVGSFVRIDDCPVLSSRIRISKSFECDWNEYLDCVYKNRVPFRLGIGADLRGASKRTSGVNLSA